MRTLTILLKRNSRISHEDFLWYYQHEHAKLFISLAAVRENVRRYDQFHALPIAMPGLPIPEYDGTAELWFDDAQSMFDVFTANDYLETVRPAERKFLDLPACGVLISVAHRII